MHQGIPETRASLIVRLPDASDAVAWDEFVAVYRPLIYRLAQKQGLQHSDADDLVQEVLTSVAQSVRKWLDRNDRGAFRAWLFRIARNAAVNLLTRRSTRTLATGDVESNGQFDAIAAASCESEFGLEYRLEVFRFAAGQVRPSVTASTWSAFWLTHVEGMSVEQAAEKLNMSVGNVYVARSRVMARLRQQVNAIEADQ